MAKKFNITGNCSAKKHYMADVSKKLETVYAMVEYGDYFIINRPRQYGKTTTLFSISDKYIKSADYVVFNISFEGIGDKVFETESAFCGSFVRNIANFASISLPEVEDWLDETASSVTTMAILSKTITRLAEKTSKKLILIIDEVDKSANNQLFISFLAMLRNKYLVQDTFKTFHSIVLAGVHDVKSLKLKLRPDEEQKYNSPWNIAAEFKVDMNLQVAEIKPMLTDYCQERGVTMNINAIAEKLFYYTSGYPFLVSKLCKMIDEDILPEREAQAWTLEDLEVAVQELLAESNTNFDNLIKYLENSEELFNYIYALIIENDARPFNIHNPIVNLAHIYGMIARENGRTVIHNRIYREMIANYMTDKTHKSAITDHVEYGTGYKNANGTLNMEAVMLGFQAFMKKEYSKKDRDFLERNGRLVFLAFLKPIINGSGYDFKEPQISDEKRLDVVITHLKNKYVAELKIWRGPQAHERGLQQLHDYLDFQGLPEGFLLIFDHSEIKNWKSEWTEINEKKIFAVWV